MDRQTINATIAKITELMKRLGSGQPRPVTNVLDDYDTFRRQVRLLQDAGVLDSESHRDTRRIVHKFIDQFDANIETIITTRYETARRDYDTAKTAAHKQVVVRDAADELERLVRYPEHREHSLLRRVLNALREWESKLGVNTNR